MSLPLLVALLKLYNHVPSSFLFIWSPCSLYLLLVVEWVWRWKIGHRSYWSFFGEKKPRLNSFRKTSRYFDILGTWFCLYFSASPRKDDTWCSCLSLPRGTFCQSLTADSNVKVLPKKLLMCSFISSAVSSLILTWFLWKPLPSTETMPPLVNLYPMPGTQHLAWFLVCQEKTCDKLFFFCPDYKKL